jgi:hypothetical protein
LLQFCQCAHFSNGNIAISPRIDDSDANSSSPISSTAKMPAGIEQNEQQIIGPFNPWPNCDIFWLNTYNKIGLSFKLRKFKGKQKWFQINVSVYFAGN